MPYSLLAPQEMAFDRGLAKLRLDRRSFRNIILEFIGTMLFTIWGSEGNSFEAAIRNGLVLAAVIYFTDGGHINPWVSFSALLTRNINPILFVFYFIVQIGGALIGAVWLIALLPNTDDGPGTFRPNGITLGQVFAHEALGQFFFIMVVQSVALRFTGFSNPNVDITAPGSFGGVGGLVIGFSLAGIAYGIGPYTGASVNLARTLASAIVFRDIKAWTVGVYVLAQFTGTLLASLFAAIAFGVGKPITAIIKPGADLNGASTPLLNSAQSHIYRGEPAAADISLANNKRPAKNTTNSRTLV